MQVPSRTPEKVSRDGFRSQNSVYSAASLTRSSTTYAALRCRAVGTCFCQHATLQKRSFSLPVLHDATVHRTAEVPIGINLRHVAQTKLAMTRW
jgi:hypothetical protein